LNTSDYATITINGVPYNGDALTFHITGDVMELNVHITAETGGAENSYTLKITTPVEENDLYIQRWGNILAINRNTANNGGITVSDVRWYGPDGAYLGNGEYIKIQGDPENYYAEIKIGNEWRKVCRSSGGRSADRTLVYPNPVSHGKSLTLQLPEPFVGGTAVIYDMGGSLVKSALSLPEKINSINVSDLSPGIYLVHISSKNNAVETVKIIIE
jgi:hypothetical protein